MSDRQLPHRLRDAARQVGRMSPDWRNPERYFEHRDLIERELRLIATELDRVHG
jgi:hypothetical protein